MGNARFSDDFKRDAVHQITVRGYPVKVSVRRPPPNGAVSGALVSTIDSGHLGALYGGEAEEAALVG